MGWVRLSIFLGKFLFEILDEWNDEMFMWFQRKYSLIIMNKIENRFFFRYKRPVPLEHFLYTGNSTSTNKELFMIIDADQKFLDRKYVIQTSRFNGKKRMISIIVMSKRLLLKQRDRRIVNKILDRKLVMIL
jgi:superfamily II RNA helicase